MASERRKWYVVWQGTEPGICDSWAECELRVKGFPGARYKGNNLTSDKNDSSNDPRSKQHFRNSRKLSQFFLKQ